MSGEAITTAVIGAGDWGKNHIRKFHELGALKAFCETNLETQNRIKNEYGVEASSYDEILSNPAIQAIVLTTPAYSHKELGLKAIEHGKHLFIEKPIALNYEDALALNTAAKQKNVHLMVGHLLHYHPCFETLKKLVQDGELGPLRHIHARRFNIGKFRQEENVIWDLGPHDVSMVLSLAQSEPLTVQCQSSSYLLPTVSDFASLQLSFANNINAEINLSWLAPQKEHRLIVVGEKAMAVFDDTLEWDEKLRIHHHKTAMEYGKPPVLERDMEGSAVNVSYKEPLLNECATFLDSIANNKPAYSNGDEACMVTKILEQADPGVQEATHVNKAI